MPKYKCYYCKHHKDNSEFHFRNDPNRRRQFQPKCKDCGKGGSRTNEYGKNKYTTRCIECNWFRRLDINNTCKECNAKKGLKQCVVCNEILILELAFYPNRAKCIECYN